MTKSPIKSNEHGGNDYDSHYLLAIKEVPTSLIELRREMGYHPDICAIAIKEDTFSTVLASIALQLDIALDGTYDVGPLCEMLVEALRSKRFNTVSRATPHLRSSKLMNVELVETASEITLVERE
jgi:hypothetical protein